MAEYSGWSSGDTHRVVSAIWHSSMYRDTLEEVIYECEQEGLPKDEAIGSVAAWIENLVEAELRYSDALDKNPMAKEFLPDPSDLNVNYGEIAEDWLTNYEPVKSGNRRPQQSRSTKKAPAKKKTASKPKTSGKKPAARPANRRY